MSFKIAAFLITIGRFCLQSDGFIPSRLQPESVARDLGKVRLISSNAELCNDGFYHGHRPKNKLFKSSIGHRTVSCEPCDCDLSGSRSSVCDKRTGQCPCLSNYQGYRCNKCSKGYRNSSFTIPFSTITNGMSARPSYCVACGSCYTFWVSEIENLNGTSIQLIERSSSIIQSLVSHITAHNATSNDIELRFSPGHSDSSSGLDNKLTSIGELALMNKYHSDRLGSTASELREILSTSRLARINLSELADATSNCESINLDLRHQLSSKQDIFNNTGGLEDLKYRVAGSYKLIKSDLIRSELSVHFSLDLERKLELLLDFNLMDLDVPMIGLIKLLRSDINGLNNGFSLAKSTALDLEPNDKGDLLKLIILKILETANLLLKGAFNNFFEQVKADLQELGLLSIRADGLVKFVLKLEDVKNNVSRAWDEAHSLTRLTTAKNSELKHELLILKSMTESLRTDQERRAILASRVTRISRHIRDSLLRVQEFSRDFVQVSEALVRYKRIVERLQEELLSAEDEIRYKLDKCDNSDDV